MTLPFAEVIGDPIDQSKSPVIHRFWLEKIGIEGDYQRTRIGRGDLAAHIERRRAKDEWRGCNVTMPLKLDAIAIADEASDRAVAAGAANMLLPKDGRLVAGNTDVGAVMLLLSQLHEAGRAMDRITLFGNGGAARAVLVACRSVGLSNIRIQARDRAAATKLAVEFGLRLGPRPIDHPVKGDGIINATPLGMVGHDCLNCDVSQLSEEGWVFDMVAAPAETPLLRSARELGLATRTGIDMLVEQAAASFALFFGAEAPREHDEALFAMLET